MELLLTNEQRKFLQQIQGSEPHRKNYVKITVLLKLDRGIAEKEIAKFLGVDLSTIYHYKSIFKKKGLDYYLKSFYSGYWGKLSSYQISILRMELKSRIYTNSKEICEWKRDTKIKQLFLPSYSPNLNIIERLWKFMKKKAFDPVFYRNKEVFRAGILSFFENIAQYKEELESLLTLNFHVIDSQFK